MNLTKPRYNFVKNTVHSLMAKHNDLFTNKVNIRELANQLGIHIIEKPLEIGLDGAAIRHGQHRNVLVNASHSACRKNFSIAHEIGHLLLHSDFLSVDEEIHYRNPNSSEGRDPKEVEANLFAASILMPESLIKKIMEKESIDRLTEDNIFHLASKLGVSVQAFTIRLSVLRMV